ncbi:TIGR03560 family F420-dependent LLM class oxidoreductase [soil metagenome]
MQLGIHFMNFTLSGDNTTLAKHIADTAKAAEAGGASQFTFMDHYFQMEAFAPATDPMMEGYTSLGYVAALTEKMRLGLLVTGVTYRYPGLLAKIVATLDVLSEGRAMLGLGAAWYEREHLALGVPYPPLGERFELLEEALQINRQMWSENDGPFEGKHYQLAETICVPKPIQNSPHIMIGGSGEKKTLKFVARYADSCNLFGIPPEELAKKLDVLRGHCDDEGRDFDSIEKTMISSIDPLSSEFLPAMEQYAQLGISMVVVAARAPEPAKFVENVTATIGQSLYAI